MTTAHAPAALPGGFGSDAPDGDFPRTVTHFGGTTRLDRLPRRVAVISTGNLDSLVSLGMVPTASTHNNSGEHVPAYLATSRRIDDDARDQLSRMADIGLRTAPDLELLAGLEPDLIIGSYRGAGLRLYDELSAIAPTILPEGKGFNWKQDFLLVAAAVGRTERARDVLAEYDRQARALRARSAALGGPRVSVVRFGPAGLETHGTWSFCGSVLTDIGAHRPPSQSRHDNGTVLDLAAPDADLRGTVDAELLFFTRVRVEPAEQAWAAAAQCGWGALDAVRHGAARQVDAGHWHGNAGPSAALAVLDDVEAALR